MRFLFQLSTVSVGVLASRPINEDLLNEEILGTYIHVACSHDPDNMPKVIPEAVGGPNLAKFLCEWARLSEGEFLRYAEATVQETHEHVLGVSHMKAGLQRNIDSARRSGAASDDQVLAALAERYRQMLRSLIECQASLKK